MDRPPHSGTRLRRGLRWLGAAVRPYAATLVLLPLFVALAGTAWTWHRSIEPATARLADTNGRPLAGRSPVPLGFKPEGAHPLQGVLFPYRQSLLIELEEPVDRIGVSLQADSGDEYLVSGSADGESFRTLFVIESRPMPGLVTRNTPVRSSPVSVRYVRILPRMGDEPFAVSGVRIHQRVLEIDHRVVILAVWLSWLLLTGLSRVPRGDRVAAWLLERWRRFDVGVAGTIAFLVLVGVHLDALLLIGVAILLVGVPKLILRAVDTLSPAALVSIGLSLVLLFGVGPWLVGRAILAKVAEDYELTVDHRMIPDGDEINLHGLRFRGTPADLADEDFVILFMGDSFAYGNLLRYEDGYAYAFERVLIERGHARVRVVNMGWVSSSPLLSLRLLREVGQLYRPDLVIYNLDLTDFHDDLRYAAELAREDPTVGGPYRILWRAAVRRSAILSTLVARFERLRGMEIGGSAGARREPAPAPGYPADTYFVVHQPLSESIPWIERGVRKNLRAIHRHCNDRLGVPMVLALFPRAFQYSRREASESWEREWYDLDSPHLLAPFAYFESVVSDLPYPVVSLLEDFQSTDRFPLYFRNDPHWNASGARFAAEALATRIERLGLLPE